MDDLITSARSAPQDAANPLPLESVIATDELSRRPYRAADYATENGVITGLLQVLTSAREDVLQRLVDEALRICSAHSAGISILDSQEFLWRAVAGAWRTFNGARMGRSYSPSGEVLARNAPVLMKAPHRHYRFPAGLTPPIHEVLMVPIRAGTNAIGTLWVVAHDDERKFDLEDLRVLTSLSEFAATAHQLLTADDLQRRASERLLAKTAEMNRLAETSSIGLTCMDRDCRFKLVNRAYADFVGIEADRIVGRTLVEIIGETAWQVVRPNVERVLSGEPVEYEAEITLGTRGRRCIHANYTPDIDETGAVVGWIASVMDVTERRASEIAVRRGAQEKDALYQLADRLQRADSFEDAYSAALQAIISAIQCDRASILLFDEGGVMRFVAWKGLSDRYRQATEGHSPWTRDETNPHPMGVDDVGAEPMPEWLKSVIVSEGIGALAFIPLVANGRLIGKFMTYYDAPHAFSSDELELALTIARQLAFAIDRQRSQQLLREHAEQLALITNTAPVYIAYCDAHARFQFVNQSYAERLGLRPDQCVGKTIAQVIGERAYEEIRFYVEKVLAGTPVEFEVTVPYRQLGIRFMRCSYAPQFAADGSVTAFVAAISDITDRRLAEEALRRSEEELRQADRRKDEFLAMLAHELRNPLAPIANAIHLLTREPATDPVKQKAHAIIERQSARLARLVDDLLEVSRISSGRIQLHMERVSVAGVIERAIETVRPMIEQHRHTLETSFPSRPMWVMGDATRLEQVVVNLLNNAAKYTSDGGRIEVEARIEGSQAVICVKDNGIGIEPELLPRVFDLFTQAEGTLDRSRGGLGIGLSLVQRLVRMHGGVVSTVSAVGRGSEFTIRLPVLKDDRSSTDRMTVVSDTRIAPLEVLVVDDNLDAAQSLAMVLEMAGHRVSVAHSGPAALERLRIQTPQVVLLDIGLPEIDGYEVARRARRDPRLKDIVLIAMTGYGQQSDRDRSHAAGFDHHLVKPAEFASIETILQKVARSR